MMGILRAEFYKLRYSRMGRVHILLPLTYALIFFLAARTTSLRNFPPMEVIEIYLVLLAGVFPIVIGALTARTADMEGEAGNFQVLLALVPSRRKAYFGKLLTLLLGALFSLGLTLGLFALLFPNQPPGDWIREVGLIFAACPALYAIHLWTGLKFSGGASLGLGFVESLLAFLSLTVLGDKIWYYIPSTWPARLTSLFIKGKGALSFSLVQGEFFRWKLAALPISLLILLASSAWFAAWDGRAYNVE